MPAFNGLRFFCAQKRYWREFDGKWDEAIVAWTSSAPLFNKTCPFHSNSLEVKRVTLGNFTKFYPVSSEGIFFRLVSKVTRGYSINRVKSFGFLVFVYSKGNSATDG
jgi:hypothetical protein